MAKPTHHPFVEVPGGGRGLLLVAASLALWLLLAEGVLARFWVIAGACVIPVLVAGLPLRQPGSRGSTRVAPAIDQPIHQGSTHPIPLTRSGQSDSPASLVEPDSSASASSESRQRQPRPLALVGDVAKIPMLSDFANAIIQTAGVGIWLWEPESDELIVSGLWKHRLGYEPEELADGLADWQARVHPEDLEPVMEFMRQFARRQSSVPELQHRLLHKDGSVLWVVLHMMRWTTMHATDTIIGVHLDVTALKNVELNLREAQRRYRSIITNLKEVVFQTDHQGCFTFLNPAWTEITGFDVAESLGRPASDFVHPVDRELYLRMFRGIGGKGARRETARGEVRGLRADGGFCWIEIQARLTRDDQGALIGSSGTIVDVTLRVRSEQIRLHDTHQLLAAKELLENQARELSEKAAELEKARERAEGSSRAKSWFLANMSHEIRTPMAAVIGYSDMLLDPELPALEKLAALHAIRRNGSHLLQMLNDILDLSKIEAGKLDLEFERVPPWIAVAETITMLRVRAEEKGLMLRTAAAGLLPRTFSTDPTRLRQILVNLVGNAIKFTGRGEIRVEVEVEATIATPPMGRAGGWLVYRVADQGIGIGPDQIATLFVPFQQANPDTAREFGGTGLGLAISRKLAELMGGTIRVESELGVGSQFLVRLPLTAIDLADLVPPESLPALDRFGVDESSDQASEHEESQSEFHRDAATAEVNADSVADGPLKRSRLNGRVLLAEDGRDNQRVLSYYLHSVGVEVDLAENGRIAVEKATQQRYDVILMDIQMPELDGYSAARMIRQLGRSTPIVALTAHAMQGERERCLAAGCSDYLAKPVKRKILIATLTRLIKEQAESPSMEQLPDDSNRVPGDSRESVPDQIASVSAALKVGTNDEDLSRAFADQEYQTLVREYLTDLPNIIDDLRSATQRASWNDLARIAHQLAGSASMYGFDLLGDQARRLELAAQSVSDVEPADQLATLLDELERLARMAVESNNMRGVDPVTPHATLDATRE